MGARRATFWVVIDTLVMVSVTAATDIASPERGQPPCSAYQRSSPGRERRTTATARTAATGAVATWYRSLA